MRTHHIVTVLLLSSAPAVASPTPPPPDAEVSRRLIDLRAELWEAGRTKATAQLGRFRALCDKDGYPLVGNVASKGDLYQPSALCEAVRAAERRR